MNSVTAEMNWRHDELEISWFAEDDFEMKYGF
jgi:hypothetical protein